MPGAGVVLWRPCFFGRGLFRGHGSLLPRDQAPAVGAGHARDRVAFVSIFLRPRGHSDAGAWERSLSECSAARWKAGPARRAVRGRAGFRGRKQPFGAEPVGGVRNREKGASCLSAASSCPAGSAARRPGSSQRQGCPFFWFFSLGRQRKERHPAGGRWHFGGAGGWEDQADRL